MKQQGTHEQCTTARNCADNIFVLGPCRDSLLRQATLFVSAGNHPERPVVWLAFVEMQPDG